MKQTFWKADWFAGLVISPLLLLAGGSDFLQRLWRKACNLGLQASSRSAATEFAIIANTGRWSWSRDIHATMTDIPAAACANCNWIPAWLVSINRQSLPPYPSSQVPHLMIANEPHVASIIIDCMLEEMSIGVRCIVAKSLGICTWGRL